MRLTFVLAIASLSACASGVPDALVVPPAADRTVTVGADFTLAPGEAAVLSDNSLALRFVGVTGDSRCPTKMLIQCVWAGSASVALNATLASGTRELSLGTNVRDTATVGPFLVRLVTVTPERETLDAITPSAYRATLRVNSAPK